MGEAIKVDLRSNGKYWKAVWGTGSKSLGPKAKYGRRQAEALCRRLAVDLTVGIRRDGKAPRLSEWLKQYTRLRTDLGADTRTLMEHTGRYLLAYFTNDPPIDKIDRPDAAGWRAALAAGELRQANIYPKPDDLLHPDTKYQGYRKRLKEKEPKPLSEATVCKHVRCAKRIFEEATDESGIGLIPANPFRKLSGRPPKGKKNWATITPADLLRILDACPSSGWKALFALCRLAGLRRQEALDLRWDDVRWDLNRLMVNAHIDRETTKRAARVCPIEPPRCRTGLAKILREVLEAAPEGTARVCEGVSTYNLNRNAKVIVRRAGIPLYSKPFHALRKNRAGELAKEYPQHVFTEWMGHDASVAEEFYLRVDDDLYGSLPEDGTTEDQAAAAKSAQNRDQTTP